MKNLDRTQEKNKELVEKYSLVKTIRIDNSVYSLLPVPKESKQHKLNRSNFTECYLSYWLTENHHVITPYKFLTECKILGFVSSLNEPLKQILLLVNGIDPFSEILVIENPK